MSFADFKRAARNAARHANNRDRNKRIEEVESRLRAQREVKRKADRAAAEDRYLEIPDALKLNDEYISGVSNNRRFNEVYCDYYARLANERNLPKLHTLGLRLQNCHRFWFGDHYRFQRVFDVKRVQLCRDKFCVNCLHLKQATRLKRFTAIVERLREEYDLYHVVFTLPNVRSDELGSTLDVMSEGFKKISRYFSGDAKIKDMDFLQYGYAGAVRCFEIVSNPGDYHPHIHSIFVLRKGLTFIKSVVNDFSYNNGVFSGRKFSELEITVQKIWYLLCHKRKVTPDGISAVKQGYSCTMDLIEGNEWHEVFKYVTKLTKDGEPFLTYEQFVTLYDVLYRRRVMQGYGILYNIVDDDSIDEDVAAEYEKLLAQLRLVELPDEDVNFVLDELAKDIHTGVVTAISKRNIQRYLNERAKEEDNG